MRVFTPRTRRSPSFSGRSVLLDGVSDFIDLQGGVINTPIRSSVFWANSRNKPIGHQFFRPASWMFWIKVPAAEITAIKAERAATGEGIRPIIKEQGSSYLQSSGAYQWPGNHIWLVGAGTDQVRIAAGWGRQGGATVSKRVLRHGSTNVQPDTWMQICVAWTGTTGQDTSNYNPGIEMWINSYSQTMTTYYPDGTNSGELNTFPLNSGYTSGPPNTTVEASNFNVFAGCHIGNNQLEYTNMFISECAFWENYALTQNDANTLYNSGDALADITSNTGNYTGGDDIAATINNLTFSGNSHQNLIFRVSDANATHKYYHFYSDGATGTPGGILNGNAIVGFAGNDPSVAVHYNGAAGTSANFAAALTGSAGHNGTIGVSHSTSASIQLTQQTAGPTGNIRWGVRPGVFISNTWTDIDSSTSYDETYAPLTSIFSRFSGSFVGGTQPLAQWWKFDGPATDSNDNRLQASGKTVDSSTEFPNVPYWQNAWTSASLNTEPALIMGGTWTTDFPTELI